MTIITIVTPHKQQIPCKTQRFPLLSLALFVQKLKAPSHSAAMWPNLSHQLFLEASADDLHVWVGG